MRKKYKLKPLNKESLLELLNYKIDGDFELEKVIKIDVLLDLGFEYGIIYNFDSVISDRIENLNIDFSNIMEARFFNEEKEIKLMRNEKQIYASLFAEENAKPIGKKFILRNRGKDSARAQELHFKKYIAYDDDNQAYIKYTKPCKLTFKEDIQ